MASTVSLTWGRVLYSGGVQQPGRATVALCDRGRTEQPAQGRQQRSWAAPMFCIQKARVSAGCVRSRPSRAVSPFECGLPTDQCRNGQAYSGSATVDLPSPELRARLMRAGCPMTSDFPFCHFVVLDWRRLPLNFPRPAADSLIADTFMQPGNLPKRSPKRPDRQTSMSRVAALQPTKQANRTLNRPKIDNTDSS